jgi:hypothetical protein
MVLLTTVTLISGASVAYATNSGAADTTTSGGQGGKVAGEAASEEPGETEDADEPGDVDRPGDTEDDDREVSEA